MARREPDNALWRLVESPWFTTLILLVIVANAVVLGLQNEAFLGVFVVDTDRSGERAR
jgi:hypothetical protein